VKQEDHFLETYQFLNELEISYLHVFTYSERENTLAASLPQSIPMKERNERSRMLHILSDKKRRVFYEDNLNKSFTVLFENDVEDGLMHGFTENYIRVAAKYDPLLINETKPVILTSINSKGHVEVEELIDNGQLTIRAHT
jgi:threonylcarbamoyladenosine tRNA methylthiotransferase MtaB